MASSTNKLILPVAAIYGATGLLFAFLESIDLFTARLSFFCITFLLLHFLWIQLKTIHCLHPNLWMFNPLVVCTFMTFIMGYGITNILFLLPASKVSFLGLVPDIFPAMVTHQYLALVGAIMMYLGYWSVLAEKLTHPVVVARFQHRYLPKGYELRTNVVPILLMLSIAARLFSIKQGIYGYGGDYSAEMVDKTSGYSQYLALASRLGKFTLLLISLKYFAPAASQFDRGWFWIALVIELFFGIISGMKSAIVTPFLIIGIAQYVVTGRIHKKVIIAGLMAIFVAYAVVEPFRAMHNKGKVRLTSIGSILSIYQQSSEDNISVQENKVNNESTALSVLHRTNLSYMGAYGIEYADTHSTLPIGSPEFLSNILLAPVHALIPRFILDSKPLGDLGFWYNQYVMGKRHNTAIAMGPLAYLYFAGGSMAVAIGFYCIGIVQRVLWFRLTPWSNLPGSLIILGLLGTVGIISSSINGMIISLIREGIMLTLLSALIFKDRSRSSVFASVRFSMFSKS